jgi:hypothetical protein
MTALLTTLHDKINSLKLADSTKKTYKLTLNSLFFNYPDLTINDITNPKKMGKLIDDMKTKKNKPISMSSKKSVYKVLFNITTGEVKEIYREIVKSDKMREKHRDKYTPVEKTNLVSWDNIKAIKPDTLEHKIFHSFITVDNLFLRLEYFNIKLKDYNIEKDNYINNKKLYLNNHKTSNKIGVQVFILKKKTLDLIEQVDNEYLFSNHNTPTSSKSRWVVSFFRKYLEKDINNNLLRKIYINEIINKFNVLTTKQIHILAKRMLNSVETWINVYKRLKE